MKRGIVGLGLVSLACMSLVLPGARAEQTVAAPPSSPGPFEQYVPFNPDEKFDRIIEGDDVRYFLEALLEFSHSSDPATDPGKKSKVVDALLHEVFPKLIRARLTGTQKNLQILTLFDGPFRVPFEKRKAAKRFSLYGVEIPKFLRFKLTYRDSKIVIERIKDPHQTLALLVKIPVISDRVYLHRIEFNPADGSLEAEAGVLGDHLRVYARASVFEKKFEGIDYWKTFLRNYGPFLMTFWKLQWKPL